MWLPGPDASEHARGARACIGHFRRVAEEDRARKENTKRLANCT